MSKIGFVLKITISIQLGKTMANKSILLKLKQIWNKVIKHNIDNSNIRKHKINILNVFYWNLRKQAE